MVFILKQIQPLNKKFKAQTETPNLEIEKPIPMVFYQNHSLRKKIKWKNIQLQSLKSGTLGKNRNPCR